jgi:hypothetical protein
MRRRDLFLFFYFIYSAYQELEFIKVEKYRNHPFGFEIYSGSPLKNLSFFTKQIPNFVKIEQHRKHRIWTDLEG